MTRKSADPASEPRADQPGLAELRAAGTRHLPELPGRTSLRRDVIAGLNTGINGIPDGMASGLLAGVNPVFGLYANIVGPLIGGLFSSTRLMVITTTSAASLATGHALAALPAEARESALFVMVILIGVLQVLAGLLRLGWLTRFVSYSVMTGLLFGIAILIVLSQLPTVTGYAATGANALARTVDLLAHLDAVDLPSLGVAVLTLALALTLPRTRLGGFGVFVAIVFPSLLVALADLRGVELVRDAGHIARGLPLPAWPSWGHAFDVLAGALAVTVIILVQGAGVSQSVPNPDGARSSASRDFIAQGAANVAAGFFRGLPVGGSLSATALGVVSGATTRWAAILSGLCIAAVVLVLPGLVARIAMPALGALLIVAAINSVKPAELLSVWHTGWPSRAAALATFFAALFLPIEAAVGIGVGLSTLIYLTASSADVSVVALVPHGDGRIEECQPPRTFAPNQAIVLDVYGHLFFAGARTLEARLPSPRGARHPVVILRLRGRTHLGATLIDVLADYAEALRAAQGRLYISGLGEEAYEQVRHSGKLRLSGPVRAYEVSPILGQSTQRAYADAQAWLVDATKR